MAILTIDCDNQNSLKSADRFVTRLREEVKYCKILMAVNKVDLLMEGEEE